TPLGTPMSEELTDSLPPTTDEAKPAHSIERRRSQSRRVPVERGTRQHPKPPARLGRYRLREKLGAGSFGAVYRYYDEGLARDVAVKFFHAARLASTEGLAAYLQEARTLAALDHPGIVPVYDFGRTEEGACYLVSKLVRGGNLAQRIRQGKIPQAE